MFWETDGGGQEIALSVPWAVPQRQLELPVGSGDSAHNVNVGNVLSPRVSFPWS